MKQFNLATLGVVVFVIGVACRVPPSRADSLAALASDGVAGEKTEITFIKGDVSKGLTKCPGGKVKIERSGGDARLSDAKSGELIGAALSWAAMSSHKGPNGTPNPSSDVTCVGTRDGLRGASPTNGRRRRSTRSTPGARLTAGANRTRRARRRGEGVQSGQGGNDVPSA
jgi:hypothetical protein